MTKEDSQTTTISTEPLTDEQWVSTLEIQSRF